MKKSLKVAGALSAAVFVPALTQSVFAAEQNPEDLPTDQSAEPAVPAQAEHVALEQAQNEEAAAKADYEQAAADLNQAQAENDRYNDEQAKEEAQKNLDEADQNLQDAQDRALTDALNDQKQAADEEQKLKDEYDAAKKVETDAVADEEAKKADNDQKQAALEEAQQKKDDLEKQNNDAQNAYQNAQSDYENKIKENEAALSDLKNQQKDLQAKIDETTQLIQTSSTELEQYEKTLTELQQKKDDLEKQIEDQQNKLNDLCAKQEEYQKNAEENYKKELEKAQNAVSDAQKDVDNVKAEADAQNKDLDAKKEAAANTASELDKVNSDLKVNEGAAENWAKSITDYEKQIDYYNNQLSEHNAKIKDLEDQIAKLTDPAVLNQLNADLAQAKAERLLIENKMQDLLNSSSELIQMDKMGAAGFLYWLTGDQKYLYPTEKNENGNYNVVDPSAIPNTHWNSAGDATTLENIEKAIRMIELGNQYRAKEGLAPLNISPQLMMQGMLSCNEAAAAGNHPMIFPQMGENLAWGYENPYEGWYDYEKAIYDKTGSSPATGHYVNLTKVNYVATGAGWNGRSTAEQCFTRTPLDKTYTPTEMLAKLDEYKKVLADRKAELESKKADLQKQLDEADAKIALINQKIEARKAEMSSDTVKDLEFQRQNLLYETYDLQDHIVKAKDSLAGAKTAYKEWKNAADTARAKKAELEKQQSNQEKEIADALLKLDSLNSELKQKNDALDAANNHLKDILEKNDPYQKDIDETQKKIEELVKELDAVQKSILETSEKHQTTVDRLDSLHRQLSESDEALVAVTSKINSVQASIDPYKQAYDAAKKARDNAQDALDAYIPEYKSIKDASEKADDAYGSAQKIRHEASEAADIAYDVYLKAAKHAEMVSNVVVVLEGTATEDSLNDAEKDMLEAYLATQNEAIEQAKADYETAHKELAFWDPEHGEELAAWLEKAKQTADEKKAAWEKWQAILEALNKEAAEIEKSPLVIKPVSAAIGTKTPTANVQKSKNSVSTGTAENLPMWMSTLAASLGIGIVSAGKRKED